jgi:hypothetical protein
MVHLFKRLEREGFQQDVEDELLLHIDLLTQQNVQLGMPLEEAREAALKRFGNVSEIKNECVKIGERNNPVLLLLKVGLLSLFLSGVLTRIFIPGVNFRHLADLLMMVAVLGRLFMYVRSLNPSFFLPKQNTLSSLRLSNKTEPAIQSYDHRTLTPLERVIKDK